MTVKGQIEVLKGLRPGAAAWLLGLSRRTLSEADGLEQAGDKSFDARHLVAWAAGRQRPAADAKARREEAEAQLTELRLAREKGDVIGRDDHEAEIDRLCSAFSSVLGQIPALGPRVAGMTAADATKELRAWSDAVRASTFSQGSDGNDT